MPSGDFTDLRLTPNCMQVLNLGSHTPDPTPSCEPYDLKGALEAPPPFGSGPLAIASQRSLGSFWAYVRVREDL